MRPRRAIEVASLLLALALALACVDDAERPAPTLEACVLRPPPLPVPTPEPLALSVQGFALRFPDGAAVLDAAGFLERLSAANVILEQASITLVPLDPPLVLVDVGEEGHDMSDNALVALQEQHPPPAGAVGVWAVEGLIVDGARGCGSTLRHGLAAHPEHPHIAVGACNRPARTLAHELGHLLGLYHTFEPQDGPCATTGDTVCDTPPDPGTCRTVDPDACDCLAPDDACALVCDEDPAARPDPFNLMSYYRCSGDAPRLSAEQIFTMHCVAAAALR